MTDTRNHLNQIKSDQKSHQNSDLNSNKAKSGTLDQAAISQIAHLARLRENQSESKKILEDLNNIVQMVSQISKADTKGVPPMAHPIDMAQPLRPDRVTERDQRDKLLKLAPKTEAGLYLVPVVIES